MYAPISLMPPTKKLRSVPDSEYIEFTFRVRHDAGEYLKMVRRHLLEIPVEVEESVEGKFVEFKCQVHRSMEPTLELIRKHVEQLQLEVGFPLSPRAPLQWGKVFTLLAADYMGGSQTAIAGRHERIEAAYALLSTFTAEEFNILREKLENAE